MTEPEATSDAAPSGSGGARWPRAFVDALADDPRIVGAAEIDHPAWRCLLVVSTWDGLDGLASELPRIGALALGAPPAAQETRDGRWEGLSASLDRVEVELVRIGDLRPSGSGERATAVYDPRRLIEQWIRWSRGRPKAGAPAPTPSRDADLLRAHGLLALVRGSSGFLSAHAHARLRDLRGALTGGSAFETALAERLDAFLAARPVNGAGVCVHAERPGEHLDPHEAFERFAAIADGEGFLGDRMLFTAAEERLAELSRRPPVFDEGFVLPTFDAVEARWRFGEGAGRGDPRLVPAVHVGVGVTPADHLEFWAAPAVRIPPAAVACVADPGTRVVLERTAGKNAFLETLHRSVERAWSALPDLVRAAHRAARTPAGDVEAALRALHLPRSYREAVRRELSETAAPSRLDLAAGLTRVGSHEAPLHARKMALAAGRLIATTPTDARHSGTS